MAKETVIIGCRLISGILLRDPLDPENEVRIKGTRESLTIGATHAETEVDAELWARWSKVYADYQPLKAGAIFMARTPTEAKGKATELEKEKTGFERMNDAEAKKLGIEKADKKD